MITYFGFSFLFLLLENAFSVHFYTVLYTLYKKHGNSDSQFKFKGDSELGEIQNPDSTNIYMTFKLILIWTASLNFLILALQALV